MQRCEEDHELVASEAGDDVPRPELRRQPRGGRAVSYTHLRAHETVLELVCRLLLVKNTHLLHSLDVFMIT